MYFDKAINRLNFEDVVHFLEQGIAENTMLDYKLMLPKNNEKFAKTIAAFANSLGGTVIVGVKDEHDKPKPPFTGIRFHPKIRGQIESIIQNYIDPIVFVDIATCIDEKTKNMFVVVNIPQSNLTPHLVGNLKRAYVRTGQSSRPEIIVHPDNLVWLLDNRRKSQNLRHILLEKAQAHFLNYERSFQKGAEQEPYCSFALIPLYPQTPIMPYQRLTDYIDKADFNYKGETYASCRALKTVQDGVVMPLNDGSVLEVNSYGLLSLHSVMTESGYINIKKFYRDAVLFFKFASLFYKEISFISPLMLRFKIANARGAKIKIKTRDKTLIEDFVRIDRTLSPLELQDSLQEFSAKSLEEFSWAVDLPLRADGASSIVSAVLEE